METGLEMKCMRWRRCLGTGCR